MKRAPFTCPQCGRTSWHPDDARFGYCSACRNFTGDLAGYQCPACGISAAAPDGFSGALACGLGHALVLMTPLYPGRLVSARPRGRGRLDRLRSRLRNIRL